MKTSRRGLLGGILGSVAGMFLPHRAAQPAVLWEEPEDDSDLPPMDEEEEEISTTSSSPSSTSVSWSYSASSSTCRSTSFLLGH